jgi:hypothetical protein
MIFGLARELCLGTKTDAGFERRGPQSNNQLG